MRKNRKKIISLLLAICMIATLVPAICISAFADDPTNTQEVILMPRVYKTLQAGKKYVVSEAGGATYSDVYIKDGVYPVDPTYFVEVDEIYNTFEEHHETSPYGLTQSEATGYTKFYHVENNAIDPDSGLGKYGFDTCDGTFVWDDTTDKWLYWCDGNGVNNQEFYLYEYHETINDYPSKTVTPDEITAKTKTVYKLTDDEKTITSSDVSIKIKIDGTEYTIPSTEYTIEESNNKINPLSGDLTVTIKYGNVTKEVTVPYLIEITLNPAVGTTSKIYEIKGQGWYLDEAGQKQITEKANPITVPTKDGYVFAGFYTEKDGKGTQCINKDGYAVAGSEAAFSAAGTLYANWKVGPITINGIIKLDTDTVVKDAKVELYDGSVKVAETTTASDGTYSLKDIEPGVYSIVITNGKNKTTQVVTIDGTKGSKIDAGTIKLPTSLKNTVVEVKKDAPTAAVDGLNEEFNTIVKDADKGYTEADKAIVDKNGSAEIKVTVEKATVDSEYAKDIKGIADNDKLTIGMYLDLSVLKTITDEKGAVNTTKLIELPSLITLYIDIDKEVQGKGTYVIYRYHDGSIDTITSTPNADGECVTLSADGTQLILKIKKFSTYALGYSETVKDIKNASKKIEKVADTADTNMIAAYVALAGVSVISVAAVTAKKKHEN